MKDNYNTRIIGNKVILVPYRKEHVDLYHKWMQDPWLQEKTASEPLSIEEEYEMQESWRDDPKKCTFIILDRSIPDTPGTGLHGGGMVGDTNLFFNSFDDDHQAEIEIMIAEPAARGKGIGYEALVLMMYYAITKLKTTSFVAKIGEDNLPSIKMFETKFKYVEESRSAVFKEVTLLRPVDEEFVAFIGKLAEHCEIRDDYDQLSNENDNNIRSDVGIEHK